MAWHLRMEAMLVRCQIWMVGCSLCMAYTTGQDTPQLNKKPPADFEVWNPTIRDSDSHFFRLADSELWERTKNWTCSTPVFEKSFASDIKKCSLACSRKLNCSSFECKEVYGSLNRPG